MKDLSIVFFIFTLAFPTSYFAQAPVSRGGSENPFQIIHEVRATSVKNQGRTGTCWSFSAASLLESEMIRMDRASVDLSEMYAVRQTYIDKAERYARLHGKSNFSPGSLGHDVLNVVKKHGMVPESAFSGKLDPAAIFDHKKMHKKLEKALFKAVKETPLPQNWLAPFEAILDEYMGRVPETFEFEGKTYTPRTFADEVVGINPDDYVSFSSFTHHPFYESFVLEVPDNYSAGSFFNIPIQELEDVADYALSNGYSIDWDCDVSNDDFAASIGVAGTNGSLIVTQDSRQKAFDSQVVTDDHLMHITGVAKNKSGNEYYQTKNSWGETGTFNGYLYASKPYFRMNTISILIHKDAVPEEILKKLKRNNI